MAATSSESIEDLLRRCAVSSGDLSAWEEFVRRFHRLIAKVVLRTSAKFGGVSAGVVDDLIQETYLKCCADNFRILIDFEHRHPDAFVGFLQVLAANVARDYFKSAYSQKRGANQVESISEDFTPSAVVDGAGSPGAIERGILINEVRSHLELCIEGRDKDRNRRIFWLYYRAGLSAAAISVLPGIGLTTKGVESLILRMTREVRERMLAPKPVPRRSKRNAGEGILSAHSF
jgi:RNA polymerase sigma-70 factor (ECF subfamily)